MASAVLAAGVLHRFLPSSFRLTSWGVYGAVLLVLLVALVVGDPGRIDRQRRWLRVLTGALIALITVVNGVAALRLLKGILTRSPFDSAHDLLTIGAVIWLTNVIAFALWYWDLDAGGAADRAAGATRVRPALVFPEMSLREHVPSGWYPQFVDYLAASFNTATSFSVTDVSAVKRWAKLMMVVESAISLSLATLVIARAINML